jgi:hypothetical protein
MAERIEALLDFGQVGETVVATLNISSFAKAFSEII